MFQQWSSRAIGITKICIIWLFMEKVFHVCPRSFQEHGGRKTVVKIKKLAISQKAIKHTTEEKKVFHIPCLNGASIFKRERISCHLALTLHLPRQAPSDQASLAPTSAPSSLGPSSPPPPLPPLGRLSSCPKFCCFHLVSL